MIEGTALQGAALQGLTPAQKAQVIYTQARSELSGRLWRAALGGGDDEKAAGLVDKRSDPLGLDGLLALLDERTKAATQPVAVPAAERQPSCSGASEDWQDGERGPRRDGGGDGADAGSDGGGPLAMQGGPNARYSGILGAAASRTGIPAAALATIVNAEAAKGADGRWLPYSRNPRSSAAGLGQFLNGTWEGQAEREGTWLHAMAQQNGWLNERGHVRGESRGALLALRYDPQAAIETTADYARANLDALRGSGVRIGGSVVELAQSAYLGHHLGLGDAVRFLKGGLDPERARKLLNAQVGTTSATHRIEMAGSAVAAHRSWLMDYVGRNIRPEKFAG
ncbi:peptidoglycan-binding protein [Novosphingobium lindaniclasticum]